MAGFFAVLNLQIPEVSLPCVLVKGRNRVQRVGTKISLQRKTEDWVTSVTIVQMPPKGVVFKEI
jgi:hypothetical protein